MFRRILLVVALLLLFIELNFAAIPQSISYQGVLKNSSTGIAVPDDDYSMTFTLYGGSSGTTQLWTETQGSVPVALGVFSVTLGASTLIPTNLDVSHPIFLGIKIGTDPLVPEMNPRVALNMVPYSSNTTAIQGYPVATTEPKAGNLLRFNGTSWEPTKPEVAVCRWNVFDIHEITAQNTYGFSFSESTFTCGISPISWFGTNGNITLSSDKEVLRTFFNRKCYAKNNALIYSENYFVPNAASARYVLALFRIKNTTGSPISWTPNFYYTSSNFNPRSYYSYVYLNGVQAWLSPTLSIGSANTTIILPEHRTSTVIFVSATGPSFNNSGISYKTCRMAFKNLALQAGLEFVDDLDTALDGWDQ
jgi:hypothetical protein